MTVVARAPASTANLGPGFDCAAAALDLWNELYVDERANGGPWVEVEGEGADELPRDGRHLALRAFALFASPERHRFRFVNRIPLERGLGSSSAAVAAGLVAGAAVAGRTPPLEEALALGTPLEGHADNLAATLGGGICLTWQRDGRAAVARVATDLPLTPVLVVPTERQNTLESRSRLPFTVRHDEAATAAAAAALLGAAIAAGDPSLLADALGNDRLHEPYRAPGAPLLAAVRAQLPEGAAAATLSGSGPSVVVWAQRGRAAEVAAALAAALPETTVVPTKIAGGAEAA